MSLCWLFIACSTYSLFVFVNFVCGFSLTHGMNWRLIFFYVIVTMYVCYICGTASFSIPKFRSHLHRHQDLAEIKLPILCLQGNCTSSFNRIYNFMRHLDSFHASQTEARLVGSKFFSDSTAERETENLFATKTTEHDFTHEISNDQCVVSADSCLDDVRQEGISLVASLRANSSIPYNAIPHIVTSYNHMATSLMNFAEIAVNQAVDEAVGSTCALSVKDLVCEKLKNCHNPLEFLSSVYKQDSYFENMICMLSLSLSVLAPDLNLMLEKVNLFTTLFSMYQRHRP